MRIIHRYILRDFGFLFSTALVVITFVMCLGVVMKAIDYFARGVSGWLMVQLFVLSIPHLLTLGIPLATLVATLLLFGRLSFDGEITALRACGATLWYVSAPVLLMSVALSIVCFAIHAVWAPRSHFLQRRLLATAGIEDPLSLLEEGRFVRDFPGFMVYVSRKEGRKVRNVVIYEIREGRAFRNIRAESGEVQADTAKGVLRIDLYKVQMTQPDPEHPLDPSKSKYLTARHYPVEFDLENLLSSARERKRVSQMTLEELWHALRDVREAFPGLEESDLRREYAKLFVEFNQRFALSLACAMFALIGIPLGLRSHRRESSVNIGIALIVAFVFYFFILMGESLVDRPEWRPDLMEWVPIILGKLLGMWGIYRSN